MTKIERIEHTEPGYDCEYGPCVVPGCAGYGKPGRPGGGHGIHGDEWHWGVLDEGAGLYLSLTVYTDIFPATIPASHWNRGPCRRCGHQHRDDEVCAHVEQSDARRSPVVERRAYVSMTGTVEGSKVTALTPLPGGGDDLLVTVTCGRAVGLSHSAKVPVKEGRVLLLCDRGPAHVVAWAWNPAAVVCTWCRASIPPDDGARDIFYRKHADCGKMEVPCGCPARPLAERRRGTDMTLHRVSRRRRGETDGDLRGRLGIPKVQALRGTGLVCLEDVWSTGLGADEFFKVFGDPAQRAQAETFWVPLEQRLAKERASLASDPSWVTRRFQNLEKK